MNPSSAPHSGPTMSPLSVPSTHEMRQFIPSVRSSPKGPLTAQPNTEGPTMRGESAVQRPWWRNLLCCTHVAADKNGGGSESRRGRKRFSMRKGLA
ncbi:hypothetical protein BJV78DRAFT_684131 [Lactifluus subvellereus]|nr:hypothetical protein BJV78DRAFT_684131 [Lactifluus subvellereus]